VRSLFSKTTPTNIRVCEPLATVPDALATMYSWFYVYLDKVLCIPAIKRMIIARFQLPPAKTIFRTDLHDTTAPDELDQ
jgi:hypothetical protein